jgi:hypothetical protein
MISEIPKNEWKKFFDDLSRDKLEWHVTVQVLSDEHGAQVMSEGLPFAGLIFEQAGGTEQIILLTGTDTETHQTHIIPKPAKVLFEETGLGPIGLLDIEDDGGNKTLIRFSEPHNVLVEYVKTQMVAYARR